MGWPLTPGTSTPPTATGPPPTAVNNTVSVFPEKSGTLFGVPVTRHVLTTVFSGLSDPNGLAFDHGGNLYVANDQNGTVSVLPKASGTLFGVAVIENVCT